MGFFRNAIVFMLLAGVVAFASCNRKPPDLSRLQVGDFYVASSDGRDVMLLFDVVTHDSVSGRWYVENAYLAKPHEFVAKSRFGHRDEMRSDALVVGADAMPGGDTLVLDLLLDDSWQTLRFLLWQQPPVMNIEKSYLYHDSLFDVVESKAVYAHAKGYWASYSEPELDCDDYFSIVKKKLLDVHEMTMKDLELDMDVYCPDSDELVRRPLLMLIHGGAFFNGDKQSAGYKEWGHYFASRGYVVASINYRLGFQPYGSKHVDRAGYRALQDARAAICYLLRHPNRYPIDPNYLFVGGSSAGGITALNLAFMTDKDRPASSEEGVVHGLAHLFSKDEKRKEIGLEDLGGIDMVAENNGGKVNFDINAVVNMWGAVHKIEMIDNSQGTAILSFHGDADSVVAYGYDHPFTKVKMKPLNEFLCNKMYGSKCIHERAEALGMKNELHTKVGGGHSLHADCDVLTDYYTLITDTTTRFLYLRMFPRPSLSIVRNGKQQWFELQNAGEVLTCRWEAIGGRVLEAQPDRARVIFFDDEEEHELRIIGQQKNGQDFEETYYVASRGGRVEQEDEHDQYMGYLSDRSRGQSVRPLRSLRQK